MYDINPTLPTSPEVRSRWFCVLISEPGRGRSEDKLKFISKGVVFLSLLPFSFFYHTGENMGVIQRRTFPKTSAAADLLQPYGSERQVALAEC